MRVMNHETSYQLGINTFSRKRDALMNQGTIQKNLHGPIRGEHSGRVTGC